LKHLLTLKEFDKEELMELLDLTIEIKKKPALYYEKCKREGLLLLFQKTSTRTNLSFQSAINQLGGYSVVLDWDDSNFSISPIQYEISYASRNSNAIAARLKKYDDLKELAKYSKVPVINGCCEKYHPTQTLADIFSIYEIKNGFDNVNVTYVGIHNNVLNTLIIASLKLGFNLNIVTPIVNNASLDEDLMNQMENCSNIKKYASTDEIIQHTDFIYTDTWIDMENYNNPDYKEEKQKRLELMMPFQINNKMLGDNNPYIMHDMPIHPGFEISEDLIESENSIIYTQAENRMHTEKALLMYLLNKS
jgi:ornithine carbamoyltransferase